MRSVFDVVRGELAANGGILIPDREVFLTAIPAEMHRVELAAPRSPGTYWLPSSVRKRLPGASSVVNTLPPSEIWIFGQTRVHCRCQDGTHLFNNEPFRRNALQRFGDEMQMTIARVRSLASATLALRMASTIGMKYASDLPEPVPVVRT
ncbi:MAG TPA: hypothetical protein PLR37_05760 [Candidatus Accumulibacter phosphatis]|nr:hypothetical protein [Candidatus Accumulibacter phosphatis]